METCFLGSGRNALVPILQGGMNGCCRGMEAIHLLMIWEAIEELSQILAAIRACGMHELGRRGIGNQGSQRTCVAALWPPNAGPDWHRVRIWEVSQNGWALRRTENVGVKAVHVGNLVPPNILDTQIVLPGERLPPSLHPPHEAFFWL